MIQSSFCTLRIFSSTLRIFSSTIQDTLRSTTLYQIINNLSLGSDYSFREFKFIFGVVESLFRNSDFLLDGCEWILVQTHCLKG